MNLVLLGAPGSGKGTQAQLLAKRLGLFHFQTGELSRQLAKENKRIKDIVDSGKLIPQEEMTMYALDYLNKVKPDYKNILFEGFPRFVSQYEALEKFLQNKGNDIDSVITLDISKKEAVMRISSRRICKKCGEVYNLVTNPPPKKNTCGKCSGELYQRDDDNEKSVEVRFKYYRDNTKSLIDYLDRKNKLIRINGERPIEDIFQDTLKKLGVKDVNSK